MNPPLVSRSCGREEAAPGSRTRSTLIAVLPLFACVVLWGARLGGPPLASAQETSVLGTPETDTRGPGGGTPEPIPVWQALGSGLDGEVRALLVFGGDLIAAGGFSQAGGKAANHIARWDGENWHPLGEGTNGPVEALAVWNGSLVAGGDFTTAGIAAASHLAVWNGAAWAPIGGGADGPVHALAVFDGALAVGGSFTSVGSVPAANVALRSPFSWSATGSGTDGPVRALAVFDGALFAGGDFSLVGGSPAANVARWDGSSWAPLGSGTDRAVRALFADGGRLLAGGEFILAGGAPASRVAAWDGASWHALGSGVTGSVDAIALFDGLPTLGGLFDRAGGIPVKNVARIRGAAWEGFRYGPNGEVLALVEFRDDLVAGGAFGQAGSVPAAFIARYGCGEPPAPSGVAATANLCGRVRVSWNAVPGAKGYKVHRNVARIAEVGGGVLSYEDAGAPNGPSTYAVRAYDDCGESALSSSATGSPRRPAGVPAGLVAGSGSCSVVPLSWGSAANADSYRILRDGGTLAVVSAPQTAWTDAPPPGVHAYEVQAGNACGWSASATASGFALQPPAAPAEVSASDTSCAVVRIDWTAVAGAVEYRVMRGGALLATLPSGTLHHDDAPPPGRHRYAVSAGDACSWSAATADSGSLAAAPAPPRGFVARDGSCAAVLLEWSAAAATGYRLTRDGALLATLAAGSFSYSDTVGPGTYDYGLSAANACGWSAEALDPGTVLPPFPPAPPFFEASESHCSIIQLSWGASPGASGYEILRDGEFLVSLSPSALSYADSASAGSHRYALTARNACGVSDSVAATGSVLPATPGTPGAIFASDSLCGVVHVRWVAPDGADSVRIFRDREPLATLPADLSFHADSAAEGAHVYSIAARNACGWSGEVSDSGFVPPAAPAPVEDLAATRGLCSVVRLAWKAAPRAEVYHVHRDSVRIATLAADALAYEDSTSGEHAYAVLAANRCSGGEGEPGLEATGFASSAPSVPLGFTASDTSCSVVRLDWKEPAGADTLLLYRDGALTAILKPGEGRFEDRTYSGAYAYEIACASACGRSPRARATGVVLPGSPVPPSDLSASADRCDSIVVTWTDRSEDEISFDVLRDGESLGLLPADAERFADRPGAGIHEYEIRAVGTCAVTSAGRVQGRMLAPPPAPVLLEPADLASVLGGAPIALLWSPVDGASGYRVRAAATGSSHDLVDTLLSTDEDSLVFPYLPPGTYVWSVATAAPCGEGDFSPPNRFTREAIGAFGLSNRAVSFGHDPLGGPAGGSPPDPEPDAVVVRNEGEIGFGWGADPSDPWIRVDPDSGFLASGESETLLVAVLANELLSGQFVGRIFVETDLASRPSDTVEVDLSVKQYPLGDCNGNGNLDERDVAALVDHVIDALPLWSPIVRLGLADVDFDDAVGRADLDRLPPIIGTGLLSDRPDAEEDPGEEGVLWVAMSPDSFVVSLEGTGDVRAGAIRLRLTEGSGAREIRVSPLAASFGAAVVQDGRDLVLVFDFVEGDPRTLDGGTRIDLLSLSWDAGDEPSMEFVWGGVAPSGSERFPIARAEWYRLGGPGSRRFAFFPIRPTPFSVECLISFELPSAMPVSLRAYGPSGRLVRTILSGDHPAGFHSVAWDGRDDSGRRVGLGTYFVRLESPRGTITRRAVIVR